MEIPNPKFREFQTYHVTISKRNIREIMNVNMKKGENVESDDYLIKVKFRPLPMIKRSVKGKSRLPKDLKTLQTEKMVFQQKVKTVSQC